MTAGGGPSDTRCFDRAGARDDPALWSAHSAGGIVATAHYLATTAGARALGQGGNAIDAAVAASFALAVCESAGSGLGGMALMLVHLAGPDRTFTIEGPCRAPLLATPGEVARSRRYEGHRAVAVPTHVAVMRHAAGRYGTLSPAALLEPAIGLAEDGYRLTALQRQLRVDHRRKLRRGGAAELFLDERGEPPPVGTAERQPALAATLHRLAREGLDDFYRGEIARRIDADMQRYGGFLRAADLETAALVREAQPLTGHFDDGTVATVGPPGGGLALIEMLHMLPHVAPGSVRPDEPAGTLAVAAVIRQARRDRRAWRRAVGTETVGAAACLADPEFAAERARLVLAELARPRPAAPQPPPLPREERETSHVVTADRDGNVVSLTQSIERSFGAGVVTPELGFVYNGYLRAFKVRNRRHPHYLRPGTPARSNAAPTMAFDAHGRARAALGSTGSERLLSGVFQVLLRLRDDGPFAAVHAPRLHCTPRSHVLWEEARFPARCREALVSRGFTTEALEPYSFHVGGLQLAARDERGWTGVAEPRRDGAASGPLRGRDG